MKINNTEFIIGTNLGSCDVALLPGRSIMAGFPNLQVRVKSIIKLNKMEEILLKTNCVVNKTSIFSAIFEDFFPRKKENYLNNFVSLPQKFEELEIKRIIFGLKSGKERDVGLIIEQIDKTISFFKDKVLFCILLKENETFKTIDKIDKFTKKFDTKYVKFALDFDSIKSLDLNQLLKKIDIDYILMNEPQSEDNINLILNLEFNGMVCLETNGNLKEKGRFLKEISRKLLKNDNLFKA